MKDAIVRLIRYEQSCQRDETLTTQERAQTEGVLRGWTRKCSMREQAVLCAAIRGCDGLPKSDPSKSIIWALRYAVLNPSASPEDDDPFLFTTFMGYKQSFGEDVLRFLDDLDPYPFHFIQHLAHAAHIIAVYHPEIAHRGFWQSLYNSIIIEGMHAMPERDDVMVHRLRDR